MPKIHESKRLALVICLFTIFVWFSAVGPTHAEDYKLSFSTFLGGSDWEHARDICVDAEGNIIVVGGTASKDFPVTDGAFQIQNDQTGSEIGSGGYCDAFVAKFSPDGKLLWSSYLGGPNYDRAYGVRVDEAGSIYVCGRAGPGFPVSNSAFQAEFKGSNAGIYGEQNGFIAKIKPDGTAIEWASYVGVNILCRDLSIDDRGDVYLVMSYPGKGDKPPAEWFTNAFRKEPAGGTEVGAIKISTDGETVYWATWFGGSANEVPACGIRIDGDKNVYLNFSTLSNDVPTTKGSHDTTYNGAMDTFVAKLSSDGSDLLYGTYFGGTENEEGNSTHNLAVDSAGNAYLVSSSESHDLPVTNDAMQPKPTASERTLFIAKFSPEGKLEQCTYVPGSGNSSADGISLAPDGRLIFVGTTASGDWIVTPNALQKLIVKANDAHITVFSPDLQQIEFSTLLGGASYDDARCCCVDSQGTIYFSGSTNGPGWPMRHAYQSEFAGGGGGKELCYKGGCYAGDLMVVKLQIKKE